MGRQTAVLMANEILSSKYILCKEIPDDATVDKLIERAQSEALDNPCGSFYRL